MKKLLIFFFFSIFFLISGDNILLNQILDQGDELFSKNNFEKALLSYQQALNIAPDDIYALQGAASSSAELKLYLQAGKYFEAAGQSSKIGLFYLNAGMVYRDGGYFPDALRSYKQCLQLDKTSKQCHIKLAELYNLLGDTNLVQQHLLFAIQLDPKDSSLSHHLGDVYNNLKQFQLAINTYTKAIQLSSSPSQIIPLLISLGDVHTNIKLSTKALEFYQQAYVMIQKYKSKEMTTKLLSFELNSRIGILFSQLPLASWSGYEEHVHSILLTTEHLLRVQRNQPSLLSPYRSLFLPISPQFLAKISSSWVQGYAKEIQLISSPANVNVNATVAMTVAAVAAVDPSLPEEININELSNISIKEEISDNSHKEFQFLRVGYISRRFEDYPGTQMMLRLFAFHNRSRIQLHSYAVGPDDLSRYRQLVIRYSDQFHDLSLHTLDQSTALIQQDQLDILIDYDGIHDFNSLKLLMKLSRGRSSRIHVTWLGFAGTTGMTHQEGISYIMVDQHIAPPDLLFSSSSPSSSSATTTAPVSSSNHRGGFTEKLVYLPGCYQPQDEYQGQDIPSSLASSPQFELSLQWFHNRTTQREHLLSSHYSNWKTFINPLEKTRILNSFWFICFNRVEKITPDIFEDWMFILSRSSQAILIIMAESEEVQSHLKAHFHSFGLSSSRLLFLNRLPHDSYLLTLAISDLFLDTIYYDAHTTASDALYGSLPILTRPVTQMSSRISSSLNSILEMESLITRSRREYVDLAVQLSLNPVILTHLRRHIHHQLGRKIFNSRQFSHNLERVYQTMRSLYPRIGHIYLTNGSG